jgi:hypothetical protein
MLDSMIAKNRSSSKNNDGSDTQNCSVSFWNLSIAWYCSELEHTQFRKVGQFPFAAEWGETPTLLVPLERDNFNYLIEGIQVSYF